MPDNRIFKLIRIYARRPHDSGGYTPPVDPPVSPRNYAYLQAYAGAPVDASYVHRVAFGVE